MTTKPRQVTTGPHLTMDLRVDGKSIGVGTLTADEPPGSMSSDEPNGQRLVYIFGWLISGERGVWRSVYGIDTANSAIRQITSLGLEKLSDLSEPFDLTIYRHGHPLVVHFTHMPGTTLED